MSMHKQDMRFRLAFLLDEPDFPGIVELSNAESSVARILISMSYEKYSLASWRAMEAIGKITAAMPEPKVRNLIQRLLWMMREESGTNPWSAGQIISEILRNNPTPFEDVVPIIITFHKEKILRTGSLWCMYRVGEVRPDLVVPFSDVALHYLHSEDPEDRGHALLALKGMGRGEHLPAARELLEDEEPFLYYDGRGMCEVSIRDLARETVESLHG
jgi:hypothetical protein